MACVFSRLADLDSSSVKRYQPVQHTYQPSGHDSKSAALVSLIRYLYVNSRAWPAGCVISDPMCPPPIAEEIDLHVIDLKSLREERRSLRAHRAFTPNDECFFIFLDVSRDFVARWVTERDRPLFQEQVQLSNLFV